MEQKRTVFCLVDHKNYDLIDGVFLEDLDGSIKALIRRDFPKAANQDFICSEHLVHYRLQKMDQMIAKDYRQNRRINQKLTRVMEKDAYEVVDVQKQLENSLTFGQRVADAVAQFGGSWPFIISFVSLMILWILINTFHWFGINFDAFPFILLNLFLSMVAAVQAPFIMMSQNRAAKYDRMESRNDYHVNLKSEEEIRVLHSKIDHLIQQDQPNILQIQKIQTEMLGSIESQVNELRRLQNYFEENQADKQQASNQKND
ncbi:DUF1003 domain-containing protein [Liquorilactobacillus satsumensis]|uniref:Cyclic nucleotide-binding protein n=1 Tax=Liquorilactobacillus satsumensis DSM 16230 = JCM 12392 TaxID=1423801 RepID=A0A0R1V0A3_9LACO|nr:DUF1003 domain-containing protein [Liquorilactobacillus satsumensis]KRL99052.1 hypothetical protein FD50_GL000324 [Liquorilactobacillus satsumensis DSM 16230 = JCM 12392]MCP9312288.1 DUF1003 domain-containing protein [Liquorilactobacillus satsumensis]MCP9328793.1 DUF1003 domain-containing protein [Liquorilactobacillus satsumensis]MCP9357159.1 DUF1003 domain-containing protein [Liquorilactobacillus satsumensis]MCP9359567.1 DUF1003 domain-containing protein [Liquorilactobacillus satsumensis]